MALLTSLKLWLMVFLASAGLLNGLEFEMQTQQKCIFEEINSHVIVVGDWKAFHRDHVDTPVFVELRVSYSSR